MSPESGAITANTPNMILPSLWMIHDVSLQGSDPLSIQMHTTSATDKITVYANRPIPTKVQFSHLDISNRPARSVTMSAGGNGRHTTWGVRRRSGDSGIGSTGSSNGSSFTSPGSSVYPTLEEPGSSSPPQHLTSKVYYFEVTLDFSSASMLPHRRSLSELGGPINLQVAIGFVGAGSSRGNFSAWPGELADSIGWGSEGLYVNGRKYDNSNITSKINGAPHFVYGDVIGCGIETAGMQRVFFTYNGKMIIPPSANTSFIGTDGPNNIMESMRTQYPAVAFYPTSNACVIKANFGLDSRYPFRWPGDNKLNFLWQQPSGQYRLSRTTQSLSMGALPNTTITRTGSAAVSDGSRSPSPYYNLDLSGLDNDPINVDPSALLTRSAHRHPNSVSVTSSPLRPPTSSPSGGAQVTAVYGTKNSKRSLEDDDPSAAANIDHFNLPTSGTSSTTPTWLISGGTGRQTRSQTFNTTESSLPTHSQTLRPGEDYIAGTPASPSDPVLRRLDSSRRRREQRSQHRRVNEFAMNGVAVDETNLEGVSVPHSISTYVQSGEICPASSLQLSTPFSQGDAIISNHESKVDNSIRDKLDEGSRNEGMPGSATHVASGELLRLAKENSRLLLNASISKEIDTSQIRELLERCSKDQERLQVKLSNALEESDAVDNLEELFGINDGICSAMEAGRNALKKERDRGKKKALEGPTIELLVENYDVFSLICMLRAQNEKRLQAALALMKFAKENEALSNEIRSSGGVHSFLTLFRTKGMPRELQVVACMAVAYTLPSFVASSQTSPTLGLKIMECLRFLVSSNPVTPNGVTISREDMCKAASMGVNILWINAIHPLITMEKAKNESKIAGPLSKESHSFRLGRLRSRTGKGIFDQGQESIEIQELTDSAVTLVAYLAKLSQTGQLGTEMAYDIVDQVCEVDEARPIAVREGLLAIFVEWIRSGNIDKIRPAASALRYLISIKDKYMAGWIHSQVVKEGAVKAIVKLLNESVGHDVRVAVAQMLSALCVAPHTRAAVVEANCVHYLVALLYDHTAPDSEEIVYCAESALLRLAAGAMTHTSSATMVNLSSAENSKSSLQGNVLNEIIEGWAHGSFVQIALNHCGKLRSVSIEALRVLSEDSSTVRQTRLQLCSASAAEAFGCTIKENRSIVEPLGFEGQFIDEEGTLTVAIKDTFEALRGLANILEPQKEIRTSQQARRISSIQLDSEEILIKGCLDLHKSGGLSGIVWVSALPWHPSPVAEGAMISFDRTDLIEEACRLLANLAPLLLSDAAASDGITMWASDIFEAFDSIFQRMDDGDIGMSADDLLSEINIDALRGLGSLAQYEPLKIRIVNQTLPRLLLFKSLSDERNDIATAANQVLLSLGFTEDEITVQVAGNNPQLLVDWFCLQRALLLQAMARAEVKAKVLDLWQLPFSEIDTADLEEMRLIRQVSQQTENSNSSSMESIEDPLIKDLFSNFTNDYDSKENRSVLSQQYHDVYKKGDVSRMSLPFHFVDKESRLPTKDFKNENLMSSQVYPLNDISEEKDWVLSHRRDMDMIAGLQKFSVSGTMPERVEKLLDSCFPSRLLRSNFVPINDLRPESTFNFRALMMPKRRYFSFRREGQVLARLCDKLAKEIDNEVHWTIGFTNSTFAGEFVESLVQTLYLCPMISGLSFTRNSEWLVMGDSETEIDADDGGGLLANLAGSLPPWVSYLTFDNVLNDRDLRVLVTILENVGKLSSGKDFDGDTSQVSVRQSQGKFCCLCVRNSIQISREAWSSFFQTLGRLGPAKRSTNPAPLATLKILDLSGNKLGDEAAAMVLELVHDKDSGCNLEQIDLSGNRIGRGTNVIRVLRAYTEYYRYNQRVGVKMLRKSWKSSLRALILAENDLFLGQAGLEILALLKHNALCLRFLDLSNNSLEGDTYQLLASSLGKNTALCHLNLSGNKFSSALIDLILEHLNSGDTQCSLSFLLFENNVPALNENQRSNLAAFLRRSRKMAIERFIKENETEQIDSIDAATRQRGELELIDEETSKFISRDSFSARQADQQSYPLVSADVHADPEDNMITVLFSAPLVFSDGKNELHPFAKLDFEMERELLWQCMKEASRDIEMSFDIAHHSRLLATLTRRCSVLHYSGHGHPTFLPFEDGMGGPNWLDVQDIKELILQDGVVPFKFVFVSACHSGLAGETFASAGVPHVVCCKQESELKDTAALAFTRSFYLALLVGHTVKESFEQGCKAVRATPNLRDPDKEMEKFVLLPKDGNHNVPVFRAKPIREWPKQAKNHGLARSKSSRRRGSRNSLLLRMKGTMALGAKGSELSVRNMMQEDPSPTAPQFFLGREVDMYYVISALIKLRKRLVTILGETGIGRSSLACAICHYINERASTISDIQHIYFIKPKHGGRNVSCRSLLRQLIDKLEENDKCQPTDDDIDTESMLDIICRSLKQDKCLIVFDRTELLESLDESQELPMILSTIMYETKQVKVIITARNALGQPSIGGQVEHPYTLAPLSFANTVKLFANLCPHLHTPSDRVMLSKILVREDDGQQYPLPEGETIKERTTNIFSMIGNGIPAKIEKAAYSISKEELSKLQQL